MIFYIDLMTDIGIRLLGLKSCLKHLWQLGGLSSLFNDFEHQCAHFIRVWITITSWSDYGKDELGKSIHSANI